MKLLLTKIILAPLILISSWFSKPLPDVIPVSQPVLLGDTAPFNGTTYTLSGSGVTSSATTVTLSSFTIPQSGYKIADADNIGATFYMTLEPGSRTRQEIVSCTTHTQNAAGTATLSGCTRGLSPMSPYAASTTLRFAHPGGSQVIYGTAAQLFAQYAATANTQTITGQWTFDDNDSFRPRIDADTDTAVSTAFVTLGQLSRQAISGASNASESTKGIVELATAIEQASSTSAGSTAALLSLRALYATSSPKIGCDGTANAGALCSVVARNNGTISPLFIGTTSSDVYNFNGLFSSNASTSLNATTSIAASSVLSRAFILNGLAYAFPSARAASSTILAENGSGTLSWVSPASTMLFNGYDGTNTAGTASTTLKTITLPANTLTTGKSIRGHVSWQWPIVAVSSRCAVDFGNGNATTSIAATGQMSGFIGATSDFYIYATSTTAQDAKSQTIVNVNVNGFDTAGTVTGGAFFTPYTTTGTLYLAFTCRAGSGDTVRLGSLTIEQLSQ